jgi:hypothetical protein
MTATALIYPEQLWDLFGSWRSEDANSWTGLNMSGTWPASIKDAVTIAWRIKDGESFKGWQPLPCQRELLKQIRADERWKNGP